MSARSLPTDDVDLAGEVWQLMFAFFMHTRPQRDAALGRFGLTPGDAKAMASLQTRDGRTMKQLAQTWGCDASTATWTVDRLERMGLAARAPHPDDRRSKLVRLTRKGARTRDALHRAMNEPPPELRQLDPTDLAGLRILLAKLPHGGARDAR